MNTLTKNIIRHPCVSYWGIHKSARVLDLLVSFYFPLYNLTHQDFFTYYSTLGFVEALIYEADEDVEDNYAGRQEFSDINPWQYRKDLILSLLQELDLEHPSITEQLDKISELAQLEKKLISEKNISHTDIIQTAEVRSADIRTLHCILVKMLGLSVNKDYFATLLPVEVLGEIEDDLKSYKKDIQNNSYNTYRMFVKLYGKEAKNYLQAEMNRYINLFQTRLEKLPAATQKKFLEVRATYEQKYPSPSFPEPIIE